MSDWIYIGEFETLPETEFIHCDTRDFHALCTDGDKKYSYEIFKGIRRCENRNEIARCKIPHNEILQILKNLEKRSGGRGEWRMITTKSHPSWLKYIRFVKTAEKDNSDNPLYIAYTACGETYRVITRSILEEEPIEKYLSFIEKD